MKTKLILFVLLVIFSLPAEAQRPQRSLNRDHHSGYEAVALPMHHADFQHLYALVSQQGTDSRKILAARPVLETNMLSSNQVSVLVSLLTFERNKLELAKTAWARVYDPGNYFKVLNTFTFNSSIRELCETMEAFPRSGNASHAGLNGDRRNFRKLHMHPADFAEAKTAIVHQHNDAIRLMIARQLAFNNIYDFLSGLRVDECIHF